MAALCRIVRLEELVSDYRARAEREVQDIEQAMEDGHITPEEFGRVVEILDAWMQFAGHVATELTVVADGAEMVRTLANTFAVTPKVARKFREKGADYERLVEADEELGKLLVFPVPHDGPRAA